MPSVLQHQITAAASLGPNPIADLRITCDNAESTLYLTTPDMKELVAALAQSEKYPEAAKDAEDRLTAIWHHIGEKKVLEDKVQDLESTNTELSAAVAQMTSGVPVGWLLTYSNGDVEATAYDDRRASVLSVHPSTKAEPLFLATNGGPQAAELAAKVEALGIELAREKRMREETRKDLVAANDEVLALKARVATLLSGERLTKDALAAAEKNRDSWKERALLAEDAATKAIKDRAAAESDVRHLKDETRRMEREASVNLSRLTDARRCVEAAESRLRDLETSAEPAAWGIVDSCNVVQGAYLSNAQAEEAIADLLWSVAPLYRHPPKTGEPVAWRYSSAKFPGTTPFFLTESRRQPGLVETPLYEAPPPAAIGVTDERFAVLKSFDDADIIAADGGASDHFLTVARDPRSDTDPAFADGNASPWFRSVGSLDECRRAMDRDGEEQPNSIVRIVPINAPTVDVAAIRKALRTLRCVGYGHITIKNLDEIAAAIGEKG